MTVWVTSDCHFGHKNILAYCPESRPFSDIDIHDAVLIENWNFNVKPEDTIYVLGDFFMGPIGLVDEILPQLNGNIKLVCGNHDEKRRLKKLQEYGVEILSYREGYQMFHDGVLLFMNHFPYEDNHLIDDNRCFDVYLYGHIHDKAPTGFVPGSPYNSFHVGVDTNLLTPVNLSDIAEKFKEWKNVQRTFNLD